MMVSVQQRGRQAALTERSGRKLINTDQDQSPSCTQRGDAHIQTDVHAEEHPNTHGNTAIHALKHTHTDTEHAQRFSSSSPPASQLQILNFLH